MFDENRRGWRAVRRAGCVLVALTVLIVGAVIAWFVIFVVYGGGAAVGPL